MLERYFTYILCDHHNRMIIKKSVNCELLTMIFFVNIMMNWVHILFIPYTWIAINNENKDNRLVIEAPNLMIVSFDLHII